jgi:ubiquinone/menaquinone biosynthesis C-methylase UbiE
MLTARTDVEQQYQTVEQQYQTVEQQYQTPDNLNARSAIYRFATPQTPWPRWVFDQLATLPATARILELGCGTGALWTKNLDRLPPGWRVTLLDQSAGMLAAARRDLNFPAVRADAAQLPFADTSFDAVVANHMLYHLGDLPRGLAEIRRVLTPGGTLVAATNSVAHLRRMQDLINHFLDDASPLAGHKPFSLENGPAQLRPFFAHIETRTTRGELRVTDPEAIVRYVLSVEGAPQRVTGAKLDELRRIATDEISTHGAFVLETAAGMLIATTS